MKNVLFILFCFTLSSYSSCQTGNRPTGFLKQTESLTKMTGAENVWVFIMAGQSNMAGRGVVEPNDLIAEKRLLTINKDGLPVIAREPLHFYEPSLAGLDCGYSFGTTMLRNIPDSISILLIPCAVGGSSISQWLGDSVHRNIRLFSNFLEKIAIGRKLGTVKGILWHQGESDANDRDIPLYGKRLSVLISRFRSAAADSNLPVLLGELGSFSGDKMNWDLVNLAIREYSLQDSMTAVITTADLQHKGDNIHFDSEGQRKMGARFAEAYLKKFIGTASQEK